MGQQAFETTARREAPVTAVQVSALQANAAAFWGLADQVRDEFAGACERFEQAVLAEAGAR